jgi:hypothetical protein
MIMGRRKKDEELMVIDTDHYLVEITKPAYKELVKFCKENRISFDYFFFEFNDFEVFND